MKILNKIRRRDSGEIAQLRRTGEELRLQMSRCVRRQEELKRVIERCQTLYDSAPDIYFSLSPDGNVTAVNQSGADQLGYAKEELLGMSLSGIVYEDDWTRVQDQIEKVFREKLKETELEFRKVRKDGTVIWVQERTRLTLDKEGNPIELHVMCRDITEYKRIRDALRESEERFRTVADFAYDWEYWIGPDGGFIYVSPSCERITGYTAGEFVADPDLLEKIAHPDDHDMVTRHLKAELENGTAYGFDFRIITKTGQEHWINHLCQPVYRSDGNRLGRRATNINITERKQAEIALRESEAKYSAVIERARDGIFIAQDEKIRFANQALAEIHGCSLEDILGARYSDLIAPEFRNEVEERYKMHMAGEKVPEVYESKILRKDGTVKDVEFSVELIYYHGKPAVTGIVRDISDRKKREDEFLKIQKLESIGVLAGGIAHDFNNLLIGILGNISLARLNPKLDPDAGKLLGEAERAALRAKDLTVQLLTFSRGGAPVKKTLFISELLKELCTFSLRGSNARCVFQISEDLWPVNVDEGQLSQVINNLVLNAQQAMPAGGAITVAAENTIVSSLDKTIPLEKGRYVKISIIDQGIGIPKEHLSRIFDPYFTTKQKGSGLGLTVSYAIIKNHEGHISIQSEIGVGTTVTLYLPASRTAGTPEAASGKKPSDKSHPEGNKTPLMAADKKVMKNVASERTGHFITSI